MAYVKAKKRAVVLHSGMTAIITQTASTVGGASTERCDHGWFQVALVKTYPDKEPTSKIFSVHVTDMEKIGSVMAEMMDEQPDIVAAPDEN